MQAKLELDRLELQLQALIKSQTKSQLQMTLQVICAAAHHLARVLHCTCAHIMHDMC